MSIQPEKLFQSLRESSQKNAKERKNIAEDEREMKKSVGQNIRLRKADR